MKRYSLIPYIPVPNWPDIAKELALKDLAMPSFHHQYMQNLITQARDEFSAHLEKYLRDNLASIGYKFESREAFFNFMKRRVTRVQISPRKLEFKYWLDVDSKTSPPILFGSTTEEMSIDSQQNKITVTFGKTC